MLTIHNGFDLGMEGSRALTLGIWRQQIGIPVVAPEIAHCWQGLIWWSLQRRPQLPMPSFSVHTQGPEWLPRCDAGEEHGIHRLSNGKLAVSWLGIPQPDGTIVQRELALVPGRHVGRRRGVCLGVCRGVSPGECRGVCRGVCPGVRCGCVPRRV